jgi:hypothetical protein
MYLNNIDNFDQENKCKSLQLMKSKVEVLMNGRFYIAMIVYV